MRPIQQLPEQLANQIAAGEVIERPASVLKELLENSLDAGARRIDIDIQKGGLQLIHITDDGHGIPADELELALSRHATSKISSLLDLVQVASMGFRGEALASIASVSQLVLTSRTCDAPHASSIRLVQGEFVQQLASHPPGSSVDVAQLFYNTPARRKFLRSEQTEFRHIQDLVKRIALARFDVSINLQHNGRKVFQFRAVSDPAERINRINKVCGKNFSEHAMYIDQSGHGLRLWGWSVLPDAARSQTDMQYFYVNGRMIRDRLITHAIRMAYQDKLHPGRFPAYVLHLELDAEEVDVNVHPTKHEVRFRQARLIHDFIYAHIRQGLTGTAEDADTHLSQLRDSKDAATNTVAESTAVYSTENSILPYMRQVKDMQLLEIVEQRYAMLRLLPSKLHILDLQKAMQFSVKQAYLNEGVLNNVVSQPLLIPQTIRLSIEAVDQIESILLVLKQLGVELTRSGTDSLMVRSLPAVLKGVSIEQIFNELFLQYKQVSDIQDPVRWVDAVAQAAAISFDSSDLQGVEGLLQRLPALASLPPSVCRELTSEVLANLFKNT